jgi:hypothetical protein
MPRQLISKSQWARSHNFSPSYVTKLLKERKIFEVEGKIDPVDADRRLGATVNLAKQAVRPAAYLSVKPKRREDEVEDEIGDDEEDSESDLREDELPRSSLPDALLRARIKTERERGMHAELERKKRQGELVDAEEVRSASQARAVAEREALLAWPRRVSADMAVELGVEERLLLQVQQKYIREFLADRSKQPLRNAPQMDLAS